MHATATTLREVNASLVLEALCEDSPRSRAEVARGLGMTKPTVGNALELLRAAELVREVEPPDELHYGATYFAPDPGIGRVLGLDISRRFVRGALADLSGAVLARHTVPIITCTPEVVCATAVEIRDVLASGDGAPFELAMVGAPGVVDPVEGIIRQASAPELDGAPLAAMLTAALGFTAQAENNVDLATQAEYTVGAGRGTDDFAFLYVGAGVGAGLVLGGRPYRGHRGAAGEVDDPAEGQPDLPDSPSGDALAELALTWIAEGAETVLRPPVQPEHIFAAADAGDPLALRLRSELIRRIAVQISVLCRVADPELVVLGGRSGLACEPLLADLDAQVRGSLRYPPRLAISTLSDTPVLVGATSMGARLAWDEVVARRLNAAVQGRALTSP